MANRVEDKVIADMVAQHALWIAASDQAPGKQAVFSGMNLVGYNFTSADLSRADFSDSNCGYCDFDSATLTDANFTGANVFGASFISANLTRANFTGAITGDNYFDSATTTNMVGIPTTIQFGGGVTTTLISQSHLQLASGKIIKFISPGDTTGTPGNGTSHRGSGRSAIAAAASTCVITNNQVTASSYILVTPISLDATLTHFKAEVGSGSFTITGNAAATANWLFGWLVVNQ